MLAAVDMDTAALSQDEALAALRGQTLRVPDLTTLFPHDNWPAPQTNPLYSTVVPLVNDAIRSIAAQHPPAARRLNDDLALLTCLWFPRAERPMLEALALWTVWLVCWDDVVDAGDEGLAGDVARAQAWRKRTMQRAQLYLALEPMEDYAEAGDGEPEAWRKRALLREQLYLGLESEDVGGEGQDGEPDALDGVMKDGLTSLRALLYYSQREMLWSETADFVRQCSQEQKVRLSGLTPTYQGYMEFRRGTSAGGPLCALVEPAIGVLLPPQLRDSDLGQEARDKVCDMLGLLNDMLSLKKEVRAGCALNAVSTMLEPGVPLDDIVQRVAGQMRQSAEALGPIEAGLLDIAQDDEKDMVRAYINGCKTIVTGTLEFTLRSPRYNIANLQREDGSLEIVL